MATVIKRGANQWQVKVRRKGYPGETKTFATKSLAERWARQIESEMDRGSFVSALAAETTTLATILDRYVNEVAPSKKSEEDIRCRCRLLTKHLGHITLAALTPLVIRDYRDSRLRSVMGETVRKEILLLGRILRLLQREWDIFLPRGNPIESISLPKKSKPRERRLQAGEEERLLAAAHVYGGSIRDIIVFAIETGMRRGEIVSINWGDVDLLKRITMLRDTKNGENRIVPLSTKAAEVLQRQPRYVAGIVFPRRPDSITKAFDRICARADITGLNFHDLRHEATSRFFELGLSIMEVSTITGHKDLTVLKRYTHLRAEDLAKKLN